MIFGVHAFGADISIQKCDKRERSECLARRGAIAASVAGNGLFALQEYGTNPVMLKQARLKTPGQLTFPEKPGSTLFKSNRVLIDSEITSITSRVMEGDKVYISHPMSREEAIASEKAAIAKANASADHERRVYQSYRKRGWEEPRKQSAARVKGHVDVAAVHAKKLADIEAGKPFKHVNITVVDGSETATTLKALKAQGRSGIVVKQISPAEFALIRKLKAGGRLAAGVGAVGFAVATGMVLSNSKINLEADAEEANRVMQTPARPNRTTR